MKTLVQVLQKFIRERFYLLLGWTLIILSLSIWGQTFYTFLISSNNAALSFSEKGTIGDWTGGFTAPLLNIAGFIMIYVAFREQSNSAKDTRREFHIQRFESAFFNLINLYNQIVRTIQTNYNLKYETDFFEKSHEYLQKASNENFSLEQIKQIYQRHYENNYNYIDHFIRHLSFTIDFVHLSTAFDDHPASNPLAEKKKHLEILAAQLSTDELFLLFYHSLCDEEIALHNLRKLLVQYRFFDRLIQQKLLLHETHWINYQATI